MTAPVELMIDLETLGIHATSVVLSVGVVLFQGPEVLQTGHFGLDVDEQLALGRTRDQSTLDWWATQPGGWERINVPKVTVSQLEDELKDLSTRVTGGIWAKPAGFDLVMLRDLCGQDIWRYSKERDMSTLLGEFDPKRTTEPDFDGQRHDALADALHQANWLNVLRSAIPRIIEKQQLTEGGKIWDCKVGEVIGADVYGGADTPMREAVRTAYMAITGVEPAFIFSGWGAKLTKDERMVVETTERNRNGG